MWRTVLSTPARAAVGSGFFLLIALQYFNAGANVKALIAASPHIGFLLAPLAIYFFARAHVKVAHAMSGLMAASALFLAVAGMAANFELYLIAILLSVPLPMLIPPLSTALWRQNVPTFERGSRFSNVHIAGIIASLVSGLVISWWLKDISLFRPVLYALALLRLGSAAAALTIPSEPLTSPLQLPHAHLSLFWRDKLFGYVSLLWTIMGIANLSTMPLRVEYIASGNYGMKYSPALVIILLQVVTSAMMLLSARFWGRIFDRVNFAYMRMGINACFGLSIVTFFTPWLPLQCVGSVLFGLAGGGSPIVWNLWVTKIAPVEKTADYQAMHAFLCGIRGIAGPFLGYYLLHGMSIYHVAWLATGMVLVATLMCIPLARATRLIAHVEAVRNGVNMD